MNQKVCIPEYQYFFKCDHQGESSLKKTIVYYMVWMQENSFSLSSVTVRVKVVSKKTSLVNGLNPGVSAVCLVW